MDNKKSVSDFCEALLQLDTLEETYNFLKDLCTPSEIVALAERWRVCKLLEENNLSYREIRNITGASLSTIGRVARFLKDEPYGGYKTILEKIKNSEAFK